MRPKAVAIVLGTDAAILTANYVMIQLNNGSWRIAIVLPDTPEPGSLTPGLKLGPPSGA